MNIINYLPQILLAVFISLNISLIVRIFFEGGTLKTALLSTFRFYFMPLALIILINDIHEHKRKILFELKQNSEKEELVNTIERILSSKRKTFYFIFKIILRFYRIGIDTYVSACVDFEKKKKLKSKKKQKFYEYFLNDTKIQSAIFKLS